VDLRHRGKALKDSCYRRMQVSGVGAERIHLMQDSRKLEKDHIQIQVLRRLERKRILMRGSRRLEKKSIPMRGSRNSEKKVILMQGSRR
jgi:hypothetical protein